MPGQEMQKLLEDLEKVRRAATTGPDADWLRGIEDWKHDVTSLLEDQLRVWLKPALEGADPLMRWQPLVVAVSEAEGHVYEVPGARLFGPLGRFIEVVPKARFVFNANGRVDFVSSRGRAMLARFEPGRWSFVWTTDADGPWESAPLTEATFAQLLREMLA